MELLETSSRFKVAPPPARPREMRNGAEDAARRGLPAYLWTQLGERVREYDPSEEQVRQAAKFLDAGGWGFAETITPKMLAERPGLGDLLTQAAGWKEGQPTAGRGRAPPRANPFAEISKEARAREKQDAVDVDIETE